LWTGRETVWFEDGVGPEGGRYRNNRARGQLVKTYNVLIENNTYDGTSGPAMQV
jgi:hypothetical protein